MIAKDRTQYHTELEEVKKHLRLDSDFNDDNEYLNSLIETSTLVAENYIEKQISTTTMTMTLNEFSGDTIKVPEGNFLSLTSVTGDSVEYTEDFIKIHDDHFEIILLEDIECDEVVIVFEAGYDEDTCPAPIKQAILIKITDLYDTERGSYTLTLQNNQTFEMLLNYYKPFRFTHFRTT